MVGLVFAEDLQLTLPQWLVLGMNMAGWLWCYRQTGVDRSLNTVQLSLATLLIFCALWIAFWDAPTSIDQRMLFEQARYLARYQWTDFLAAFVSRPYVEYQPPFVTFWISRMPVLWCQQLLWFPFGLLCSGLMWQLYGRQAALLCATPVFALMVHQPSTDLLLFATLLIVLRLRDYFPQGCHLPAAFVYGLTWPIKPLTILTVPFLLPQLGIAGVGSLAMWAGYVVWSRRWEFGRRQFRFLLHQLFLKSMNSSGRRPLRPASQRSLPEQLWRRIRGIFLWRWERLGRKTLVALPFYLFPAWIRPWVWKGVLLGLIIVLGYGNSKYLLLDLLFVFPVNDDTGGITDQSTRALSRLG